jgi:hypothetical protein
MNDPRLGKRSKEGVHELRPSQTISGAVPEGIEGTIGLGDGYYAILDLFLSDERRDELVLELKSIIKGSIKAKSE